MFVWLGSAKRSGGVWFPEIDHPNRGVIAIAPPALQSELTRLAVNIGRRRRELLEMRGP